MNKKGFTLVEIMIVVGIIAVLSTIALPSILRARLDANESNALHSLQTIRDCAISYRSVNTNYPSDLSSLGNGTAPYIDSVLSSGEKQGYLFSLVGGANAFSATAQPQSYGITGKRSFYADQNGIIRYTTSDTVATEDDSPIE